MITRSPVPIRRRGAPAWAVRRPGPAARRSGARRSGARIGYRVAAVLVALSLWQVAVASGLVSAAAVATPTDIVRAAGSIAGTHAFGVALLDTIASWAEGLLVSLLVAIPLGLALGSSDPAYRLSRFTIDFLRTIPPVALIPLALLLYGATPKMAIVLIVFGSTWPVLLQAMYGVHQVDPAARDMARAYRLRWLDRIRFLIVPSAAPFIATGVRLAATISLLLAIGAELIGGAPGIGASITLQEQKGDIPGMWVYVVLSATLGVAANLVLIGLERRVLKWHSAQRSAVAA
jgi:ABC-type nitrate/sulfonate/bicarbonate transport system permease component